MTRRPGAPRVDTGTLAGQLLLLTAGLGLRSMLGAQGLPLIPASVQEVRGSGGGVGGRVWPRSGACAGLGPSPAFPPRAGLATVPCLSLETSPGKGEGFLQGPGQRGSVRPQTGGS